MRKKTVGKGKPSVTQLLQKPNKKVSAKFNNPQVLQKTSTPIPYQISV